MKKLIGHAHTMEYITPCMIARGGTADTIIVGGGGGAVIAQCVYVPSCDSDYNAVCSRTYD